LPLHIIQDIGSYAGFAAIIGLAVLSALYFSQARDVKRLREWAGRAPERADSPAPVPGRVTAQPQQPRPAAQPAATAAAGAAPAVASGPAAATPAGQAAAAPANGAVEDEETEREEEAALAGNNGDTAEGDEAAEGDEEREPVEAGVTAAAAGAGAATAAGRAAGQEGEGDEEDEDAEDAGAEDATAPVGQGQAGAQGLAGSPPAAPPRPGTPGTGAGPSRAPTLPDGSPIARPGGAAAAGAGAPGRPTTRIGSPPVPGRGGEPPWRAAGAGQTAIIPPPSRPPWYKRLLASPRYLVLAIAGVLILGGGAAFGVSQLTKSDSGTSGGAPAAQSGGSSSSGSKPSGGTSSSSTKAIDPKKVTVAVLNGTTVPGLAAQLGDKIQGFGFQLGNVTNGTDQQRAESAVLYAPGHAREAAAVARRLNIGQRERIDSQTQGLAGDAAVVVIAGIDQTH
jgi:hypothetical protein